ncbi:MAG: hypothetical protein QM638_01070 [Nocardioides sp.]|uniref:hypothetical protein n=1 Tax=Nocardioides sp. TaxID=35761 RepID=UPI0039E4A9FA
MSAQIPAQMPAQVPAQPPAPAVPSGEEAGVDAGAGSLFVIDSASDERLAQLHAQYAELKAQADEAAKRYKACTDAIKLELQQRAGPGHDAGAAQPRRIALTGVAGPSLSLAYVERWTIDSRKLKAEDPVTYVRYARKGGAWTLKAVSADEHAADGGEQ